MFDKLNLNASFLLSVTLLKILRLQTLRKYKLENNRFSKNRLFLNNLFRSIILFKGNKIITLIRMDIAFCMEIKIDKGRSKGKMPNCLII